MRSNGCSARRKRIIDVHIPILYNYLDKIPTVHRVWTVIPDIATRHARAPSRPRPNQGRLTHRCSVITVLIMKMVIKEFHGRRKARVVRLSRVTEDYFHKNE